MAYKKKRNNKFKNFKPNFKVDNNIKIEDEPKEEFKEDPLNTNMFSNKTKGFNLSHMKVLRKLGSGEFGDVSKVKNTKNNNVYARKRIELDFNDESKKRALEMELAILSEINNPCIIKLDSYIYSEGHYHIFLEYMNCGSLGDLLQVQRKLPEAVISQISFQVLQGLQYLHEKKGIVHRDIKPENILLNDKGQCKLCDFGMANMLELKKKKVFMTFQGTLIYMSPERIEGRIHSFDSDIWSFGIIVLQMMKGGFPYDINTKNNIFETLNIIKKTSIDSIFGNETERKKYSKEFIDFAKNCAQIDPSFRYSSSQLLNHPFIKKYKNHKPSFRSWLHENFIKIKKKMILMEKKKRLQNDY